MIRFFLLKKMLCVKNNGYIETKKEEEEMHE